MNFKRFISYLLGSAILVTCFFGCGERLGEKEFNKAMRAIAASEPVQARLHLEKAIKRLSGPRKAQASHQLGLICWQLQETIAATKAFHSACLLTEEITESNLNLAAAYLQSGEPEQAEVELNKILNEHPGHTGALTLKGLLHLQQSQWDSASASIKQGIANSSTAAAENLRAITEDLYRNRDSEAALQRLLGIEKQSPNYAAALFNIASIYDHWKARPQDAIRYYERYLAIAPSNSALAAAARTALEKLTNDGMETSNTSTPRTNPVLAARFIAEGARLHANRKYREAIESYRKAQDADPTNVDAIYNSGISYYDLAEYTRAAEAFQQALKLEPSNELAHYMLAASFYGLRQFNDSEREIGELLRINPRHQQGLALQKMIKNRQ